MCSPRTLRVCVCAFAILIRSPFFRPALLPPHSRTHACVRAGVNIGKALMELRLGSAHCGPPRYPGIAMPAEAKARLAADATAAGFFAKA